MIAGKAIPGFSPNEIMSAIQGTSKVLPRDPTEVTILIERALTAVVRAIRQMPDEKLDWSIPQRKRSMREFTHHIFSHALNFMKEPDSSAPAVAQLMRDGDTSFREIADYGQTVIDKYRIWVSKQDFDNLRALSPAGSETKSLAERLDQAAGAIVHHLRQLYAILETFGITPQNRVEDSKLPSDYVLTILW